MVFLGLIVGAWDIDKLSAVPVGRIVTFAAILLVLGLLAAASMEWENRRERRRWAVSVSEDLISITDQKGITTAIPTSALDVVVAGASMTAWRDDLDITLFDDCDEELISFPLVASGGDAFIKWLSGKKGFDATEFAAAETSARSTAHVIWVAD
jgi:hypothetical protein